MQQAHTPGVVLCTGTEGHPRAGAAVVVGTEVVAGGYAWSCTAEDFAKVWAWTESSVISAEEDSWDGPQW
jgi:hypothetical protein